MSPSFAMNYLVYCRNSHSIFGRNSAQRMRTAISRITTSFAGYMSRSYGKNVFLCQSGISVDFSTSYSPLGNHILMVILRRAQKKMVGIYTSGIITFMKYPHPSRYRPEMNFPRCTVSTDIVAYPISHSLFRSEPFPTIWAFRYQSPKITNGFHVLTIHESVRT